MASTAGRTATAVSTASAAPPAQHGYYGIGASQHSSGIGTVGGASQHGHHGASQHCNGISAFGGTSQHGYNVIGASQHGNGIDAFGGTSQQGYYGIGASQHGNRIGAFGDTSQHGELAGMGDLLQWQIDSLKDASINKSLLCLSVPGCFR